MINSLSLVMIHTDVILTICKMEDLFKMCASFSCWKKTLKNMGQKQNCISVLIKEDLLLSVVLTSYLFHPSYSIAWYHILVW